MEVRAETKNFNIEESRRRIFDVVPGFLTWLALTAPIVFSFFAPAGVAYFIIFFDLFFLFRALYMSRNLLYSYNRLKIETKIDWLLKLKETKDIKKAQKDLAYKIKEYKKKIWLKFPFNFLLRVIPKMWEKFFYFHYLKNFSAEIAGVKQEDVLDFDKIYHLVILATYKEELDIVRQSIEAVLKSNFPQEKILFVLATEERDKKNAVKNAKILENEFKDKFGLFFWTVHPKEVPGETAGKGANITYAARQAKKIIDEKGLKYENIITTTLDADNKVHKEYFACITYKYVVNKDRIRRSLQPIPIFNNNIWDVPAPARVVAMGNSFWQLMEATRPERLRNFSSHAQSFKTLVDTDFWSVTSIVEDGHQFWRTFFTYNGDHQVIPVFLPIYQDAVLGKTYWQTLKAQYIQLRRWAWGASDFAYVAIKSSQDAKIKTGKKILAIYRLLEGYFFWATAPLFITFTAWFPSLLNPQFKNTALAHNLPIVTSRILTVTMIGLFTSILTSAMLLPKRPARHSSVRYLFMVLQWALLPLITIFFSSLPAIDAQTRLMLGRKLGWQVTKKVRRE